MMKKIKDFINSRKIEINILMMVLVLALFWHIYNLFTYMYITIEFKELRPVHEKISIFYKGVKVGHIRSMKLCHSCKSTMVKSVLTYKGLLLPDNITAKLKKEKKGKHEHDFIELYYPEKPSDVLLSNGSIIQGKITIDIDTYMSNQDPDDLETIKKNLTQSSADLEVVLSSLGDLFVLLQDVVQENQHNLYSTTSDMSKTAKNISQVTSKFDKAIKQKNLDTSFSNLDTSISNITETTKTLQTMTGNFTSTSTNLNSTTIPQIQSTLYRTECLVANVNEITCGVKETLKKRFGGLRLIFGKTIDSSNKGCCNK